ncbi:MAG: ABC transporter ATP-binding protein [Alphaproteobacteria bacterium]
MSLLVVEAVVAGYGPHDEILKEVSLAAGVGELLALIGPNGAGKSTLLKCIAGLLRPQRGRIEFRGAAIHGLKPREISRLGIAYVPQEANVFPSLSIRENLEIAGYLDKRALARHLGRVFQRFPMLAERARRAARTLSGGQRQTLAMGMALMVEPALVLLDEPSAGLSPLAAEELFASIMEIRKDGVTVVMVEQNAVEALRIADRAYLLVDGRNSREGIAQEIANDPEIRRSFLGA